MAFAAFLKLSLVEAMGCKSDEVVKKAKKLMYYFFGSLLMNGQLQKNCLSFYVQSSLVGCQEIIKTFLYLQKTIQLFRMVLVMMVMTLQKYCCWCMRCKKRRIGHSINRQHTLSKTQTKKTFFCYKINNLLVGLSQS